MADESLHELAVSLRGAARNVMPEIKRAVSKGALNIKTQMRRDAQGHRHFRALGSSINYDVRSGVDWAEAEVGPPPGVLAGIAYFGSSRPGGGTVEDPRVALEAEEPAFVAWVGRAAGEVLNP
jgi:hypothetical protein